MIYLDFDGTVVEHRWPKMGKPVPDALRVLLRIQEKKIPIVLNTMRCEMNDNTMKESMDYLTLNNIKFTCTKEKIFPIWGVSKDKDKDIFIDDIATGIPLIKDSGKYNMVDWNSVEKILEDNEIL